MDNKGIINYLKHIIKITLLWLLSLGTLITGFGLLTVNTFLGLITLPVGLIINPSFSEIIKNKYNITISSKIKAISYIAVSIIVPGLVATMDSDIATYSLPEYTIMEKNLIHNTEKYHGHALIKEYTLNTPSKVTKRTAREIKKKESLDKLGIYITEDAFKANFSEKYSKENPGAIDEGYIGTINKNNTFTKATHYSKIQEEIKKKEDIRKEKERAAEEQRRLDRIDYSITAGICAENYIERRLKSPSTAKFAWKQATKIDAHNYRINNYVDSQNGFGAMIRMNYYCTMEVMHDNDYNCNVKCTY